MSQRASKIVAPSLVALLIFFGVLSAARAADVLAVYAHAADVNAGLFFKTADSTTYVSTGDIDAMWLRDSSVQSMSLLTQQSLVRGVIARQERLIALDPYANAFHRDYTVAEQKFELDSLCYPVRLAQRYVEATNDKSIFDRRLYGEFQIILHTIIVEQHHNDRSHYHRNEHPIREGIGLVWSAYRPSDDVGMFGPMGVDPALRGKGVGCVLAQRALLSLKELGFEHALIPAVGPVKFYERCCGARVVQRLER